METFERFLLENKAWAEYKIIGEPHFFERLADAQTPEVLWIGCSGSQVQGCAAQSTPEIPTRKQHHPRANALVPHLGTLSNVTHFY